MKSIEDYIIDKIFDIVNYALAKVIKPHIEIEDVTQLNEEMIKKIKKEHNIEGIILDVDGTIRKNMKKIPKCNEEWIENVKKELKVIVVSNGKDKHIEKVLKDKEIDYIYFANKPIKKNFIKACEKLNIKPQNVLVIGDSLFSDIYGGNKNNMKTALVKNVKEDKER